MKAINQSTVLRVTANGKVGFRRQFRVTTVGPGIFAFGNNRAVLIREDGSVNEAANPAKAEVWRCCT